MHERRPKYCSTVKSAGFESDRGLIEGPFLSHLRSRGHSEGNILRYQEDLTRMARWLAADGQSLAKLDRQHLPALLAKYLSGRAPETIKTYRSELHQWLRFNGRFALPAPPPAPWQFWLDDYGRFLTEHRGILPKTCKRNLDTVRSFLLFQFGRKQPIWTVVKPQDIWQFCEVCAKNGKPDYINSKLKTLRRFLSFVQMRGGCSVGLTSAVFLVPNFGLSTRPAVLSARQRREFLASFSRYDPAGRRDYAMALCLLDLGLRAIEVARLRISDIDAAHRCLTVPPVKTGRQRMMPMPDKIASALRDYLQNGRPQSPCDRVFVYHSRLVGQPLTSGGVQSAMIRAYERCHFPRTWRGTHRLRHTFASRLRARGASMKQIADLLGHRRLDSANYYTQVTISELRPLARPWPL